MHFHLPKPLHGWREFAGEVGIIVIGVLIALGAEQVVEHFHDRLELRDAEGAMVSELRDDNLPQAYTRAAIFNCYADQLDAIEKAVASKDRVKVLQLARQYQPVIRTWDDDAWKAAITSQVLVQTGAKRMLGWSTAYVMIPRLAITANDERAELSLLYANLSGKGSLSAEQQDRLFQVISLLRGYNRRMNAGSLTFIRFAGEQGLSLTQQQKSALLAEARKGYGFCVYEPSPELLDLKTQLTFVSDSTGSK
jgi:hypothetical protein